MAIDAEGASVTTDADLWYRASPVEWLAAAGVMAGGLAATVALVFLIIEVMTML